MFLTEFFDVDVLMSDDVEFELYIASAQYLFKNEIIKD